MAVSVGERGQLFLHFGPLLSCSLRKRLSPRIFTNSPLLEVNAQNLAQGVRVWALGLSFPGLNHTSVTL